VKAAEIIKALRNPSPAANVDKLIDEEVGPLVERVVTSARSIPMVRKMLVDYIHAVYVLAARQVGDAVRLKETAALDSAHDHAEAIEMYRALRAAYGELDKIRFGRPVDPAKIAAVGDELTKFDRPERYGKDDDED
jgi:hypothetical protein